MIAHTIGTLAFVAAGAFIYWRHRVEARMDHEWRHSEAWKAERRREMGTWVFGYPGMSEMVDRVAKAMKVAAVRGGQPSITHSMLPVMALAAIEAMREPTWAMVEIGNSEIPDNVGYANDATAVYRAMIDEALK